MNRTLCVFVATLLIGVTSGMGETPKRDINAVLASHDRELLAIPGVVGVSVGLLPDNSTPCLRVMLWHVTPDAERSIPRELEGYPVVKKITGEIRPLDGR